VILGACAVAVALSTSIAAPTAVAAAAPAPLRLTVGTLGTIGSLDPRTGDSTIAREVWNIQYPTLTALDPVTLRPSAGVAIAWTPLPNGRGWRYTLRPGLTWSDGKPVTSADVVYSLDHARDERWPYAQGMLGELRARALDTKTVVVTSRVAKRAQPGILLHVVPAHVYSKVSDLNPDVAALGVADGAWHVVARTTYSVELGVLGRPGGPPLDQIVFRTYANTDVLIGALSRGDLDVISGVSHSDIRRLDALNGVTVDPVGGTVQAFRTNNVTGFLPEPSRPSRVVLAPTVDHYAGIVRASRPPGEQLSNLTYALAAVVLAALFVAAYWIASRVHRRFVT
jgi:peptide/nickel transport system substrate-binding protein